jgi:hypothetical protein
MKVDGVGGYLPAKLLNLPGGKANGGGGGGGGLCLAICANRFIV